VDVPDSLRVLELEGDGDAVGVIGGEGEEVTVEEKVQIAELKILKCSTVRITPSSPS